MASNIQTKEDLKELKDQITRAHQIKQVMDRIHGAKDLDQIFVEFGEMILDLVDAERLTLYAVDSDKREIYSRFIDPETPKEIKELRVPINEKSLAGFVAKNREVVNVSDAYNKTEIAKINPNLSFDSSWDRRTGFRSRQMLTVPLFSSNNMLAGVMQLINKRGGDRFTRYDEERVTDIAKTIGIAFHNQYQLARKKPTKFDYLLSSGLITQVELDQAVAEARERRREIEAILIEKYRIGKKDLGESLSLFYKCPFMEYDQRIVILPDLVENISFKYLSANLWIPLRRDGNQIEILINDPYSFQKIQDIKRLFPDKEIKYYVGLGEDILKFVNSVAMGMDFVASKESMAAILGQLATEDEEKREETAGPIINENDSAVVRLANQIIVDAYRAGASDIHIEPYSQEKQTEIRFRVDGNCYEHLKVPAAYRRPLSSRLKIMAGMDIAEHRKPQDGKIKFRMPDREIELRVVTIPTQGVDNEDIVLRILPSSEPIPLDKLNMSQWNLREFKLLLEKPYGLILCVGPTGSGKTTTLHSALGHINDPETKIWTAEDPVEITQHRLRQVQVQPKIGFNFAAAMRSFLRADPDVIMVGEMRDRETAETAIAASLTGHLVFSTLHTNSAVESVTRLLEMGMEPFNFADALLGVLAQRLARTICKNCKERYHPSRQEYEALAYGYGEESFQKLGIPYDDGFSLFRGRGCEACKNSGYRGRTGIHELLVATHEIKRLVQIRATVPEIQRVAMEQGMTTLLQDGILKCIEGWTEYKQVTAVAMR